MKSTIHKKNISSYAIKLSFFALVLASVIGNAQSWKNEKVKGNGKIITEKRATTSYDEIKVAGFFDVDLISGKEGEIIIHGEENLLPHLKLEVENNALKICIEKGFYLETSSNTKLLVTVPFESITKLSLTGSGDVKTKNSIKSEKINVQLAGSGDMFIDIDSNDLEANLAGSGNMILKGKVDNLNSKLTGSGDINTYDLSAKNAKVVVAGSGDLKVFCSENLNARVAGSGGVLYKGNPKTRDTKTIGSGKITAK
jgi:Putative auto-transporter adhesin, head GIN domain